MAFDVYDRIGEVCTGTGTGNLTLTAAKTKHRRFQEVFSSSDETYYLLIDDLQWEIGKGTLSTSTTLTRDTVIASSSGGAKISLSAGNHDVFCIIPASKFIAMAADGTATNPSAIRKTIEVKDIATMQALGGVVDEDACIVLDADADGRGGLFLFKESLTPPGNNNETYASSSNSNGLWERQRIQVQLHRAANDDDMLDDTIAVINNVPSIRIDRAGDGTFATHNLFYGQGQFRGTATAAVMKSWANPENLFADGDTFLCTGRWSNGDQPFRMYKYQSGSSDTEDGNVIIAPTTGSGRYVLDNDHADFEQKIADADATPSVYRGGAFLGADDGTKITNFDDGHDNQFIIVLYDGTDFDIANNSNIDTGAGSDISVSESNPYVTLFKSATRGKWIVSSGGGKLVTKPFFGFGWGQSDSISYAESEENPEANALVYNWDDDTSAFINNTQVSSSNPLGVAGSSSESIEKTNQFLWAMEHIRKYHNEDNGQARPHYMGFDGQGNTKLKEWAKVMTITDITQGNPTVVEVDDASELSNGTEVWIEDVRGFAAADGSEAITGRFFTASGKSGNTFEINLNSVGWTNWSSLGICGFVGGNSMWTTMNSTLTAMRAAIPGTPTLDVVFGAQGESDDNVNDGPLYYDRFRVLRAFIRNQPYADENTRFVMSQPYRPSIENSSLKQAYAKIHFGGDQTSVADSTDVSVWWTAFYLHKDSAGHKLMGRRCATEFLFGQTKGIGWWPSEADGSAGKWYTRVDTVPADIVTISTGFPGLADLTFRTEESLSGSAITKESNDIDFTLSAGVYLVDAHGMIRAGVAESSGGLTLWHKPSGGSYAVQESTQMGGTASEIDDNNDIESVALSTVVIAEEGDQIKIQGLRWGGTVEFESRNVRIAKIA